MGNTNKCTMPSDALVIFGVTGDLVHKMIFPALYAMAMRPLQPDDVVRGQYAGYRKEPGVAKGSDVETFSALRLFIDSWRWEGVP
ncbi:conserved protein of unknown function [Candidatus Nitrotoga arctica]|uniref:Glucose-6-phosphate dehydrogenase C-terminal domain-containing protein n=1 Tax=Candidatus Nitrotoga arctica TaxID=453162 RepID=A0ABM8YX26_9PROT|nr:conserved protein of unknown function [Candidatus Nitrotoga arctica]